MTVAQGIDSSARAVDEVLARFGTHPLLLGALQGDFDHIPLNDNEAGTIFLIEVLEHMDNNFMAKAFDEMRRVLKEGGHLIVTVPNEENLEAKKIACPECGCVFHRVQHMQSFNRQSLAEMLHDHGFQVEFCKGLNFFDFSGDKLSRVTGFGRRVISIFRHSSPPHLLAIGKLHKY